MVNAVGFELLDASGLVYSRQINVLAEKLADFAAIQEMASEYERPIIKLEHFRFGRWITEADIMFVINIDRMLEDHPPTDCQLLLKAALLADGLQAGAAWWGHFLAIYRAQKWLGESADSTPGESGNRMTQICEDALSLAGRRLSITKAGPDELVNALVALCVHALPHNELFQLLSPMVRAEDSAGVLLELAAVQAIEGLWSNTVIPERVRFAQQKHLIGLLRDGAPVLTQILEGALQRGTALPLSWKVNPDDVKAIALERPRELISVLTKTHDVEPLLGMSPETEKNLLAGIGRQLRAVTATSPSEVDAAATAALASLDMLDRLSLRNRLRLTEVVSAVRGRGRGGGGVPTAACRRLIELLVEGKGELELDPWFEREASCIAAIKAVAGLGSVDLVAKTVAAWTDAKARGTKRARE